VTTVIQHGKAIGVTQWGIVNEPFFQGEREHDKFYQIFGGYDYIDIAFRAARKADPDAILYYNDYANHTSIRSEQRPSSIPKVELTKQIIQRLRNITVTGDDGIARPVIDAVGGWVGEPSDYTNVEETLRSYGLPVIITEFDVTVENMAGTHAEILRHQAQVYGDYLRAVYRSGVVKQVTFWGLTDEVAINSGKLNYDTAPAIIDQYNKPKLAYYEVLKVLFEQVQSLSQ
jgi:endo-1,4-beta-xylanase